MLFSRTFLPLSLVAIFFGGAAAAQPWSFAEGTAGQGTVRYATDAVTMSFACARKGTPQHKDGILEWQVTSPALLDALTVPTGEIAALGLSIDGARVGDGPFRRTADQALATSLPRDLALLDRMRSAAEISLSAAEGAASVALPLTGLDGALTELLAYCDTPAAAPTQELTIAAAPEPAATPVAPTAPSRPLAVAVTPLVPAELGGVIWDKKQVDLKLFIEIARRQPALLEVDAALQYWARMALDQRQPQQDPNWRAVTRDHLVRSIAATPVGPFLVGRGVANPMQSGARHENGVLLSRFAEPSNTTYSRELGTFQVGFSGAGTLTVRAKSQFDAARLPVGAADAQRLIAPAAKMQLGVATQIDDIEVIGTPQTNLRVVARGTVRFVGLFETQQDNTRALDPNRLVAVFGASPIATPGSGLAAAAATLNVPMYEGAVLDGNLPYGLQVSGGANAATLARLAALKLNPPEGLSDQLRNFVFFQLATQAERDAIIDPFYLSNSSGRRIDFDQHVDEFERAELLDKIDTLLWPHVQSRLPNLPFEGIAIQMTNLGEYDRTRGGFPINASAQGMGLAGQGDFPAFRALPDLLETSIDTARELVSYLEAANGPGNRRVMMVARYRLENVGDVVWDDQRLPRLTVTPLSLSMHARQTLEAGQNPFDLKFAEFEVARYRGPTRPVASPERVAFWTAINETPRSTSDQITLAALGVSETPEFLAQLVAETNAVQSASQFDRQAVSARVFTELQAMEKPSELVLDGNMTLAPFDPTRRGFAVQGTRVDYQRGELGLPYTGVEFVNPEAFAFLQPDEQLARKFSQGSRNGNIVLPVTVWLTPVLAETARNRTTLYARVTRIVMQAPGEDGSGYPSGHLEIIPEEAVAAGAGARADTVALDPPTTLPLDREYVDLMMVREEGDALEEATFARLMEDRRMREVTAAAIGYDLPWGAFFDAPEAALNPVQRRRLLAEFTTWTKARADVLPASVYVQTTGTGILPTGVQCWFLSPPPGGNASQVLPAGLVRALSAEDYNRHAVDLQTFARAAGRDVSQWPTLYYALYGSPAIRAAGAGAVDGTSGQCRSNSRVAIDREAMGVARTWGTLVAVQGAYRGPLGAQHSGRDSYFYRDYGTLTVAGREGDTIRLALEVSRTEVIAPQAEGAGYSYRSIALLDDSALPKAPLTVDIFGIEPGASWETARAAAVDRLGAAIVLENNGPPPGFRVVTQNTILGPKPEFQAFRNGHFFLDPQKGEALALIREAERDADRVLAVGSHRTFAPDTVTEEALIGALLRKYGASPRTEGDQSLRGPRPGQSLLWGAQAGCLPNMRDELRPDFTALQGQQDVRPLQNMARTFKAPSLTYSGASSVIFESCDPMVWALVGQDAEKRIHLVVWSLDMALLDEIAQRPEPNAKADGESGSEALMEKAADIDL